MGTFWRMVMAAPCELASPGRGVTFSAPRAVIVAGGLTPTNVAEAVQSLWPGTQVTIGPVIENGFYYDFAYPRGFTPEDLVAAGTLPAIAVDRRAQDPLAALKAFYQLVFRPFFWEKTVHGLSQIAHSSQAAPQKRGRGPTEA